MAVRQPNILLFGDQTETNLDIQGLYLHAETSENLRVFLSTSYETVNQVLDASLEGKRRDSYRFNSWLQLEQSLNSQQVPDVVLRTIALCFAQLGHFIRIVEKDASVRSAWTSQNFIVSASCAGQIPAALVASTQTLEDLVRASPEIMAIAVRTGLDVDRRTALRNDDRTKSWATAVGIDLASVHSALANFHSHKNMAPSEGLYAGVTSAWATTIIGPPKLQVEFFAAKPFAESIKTTPLPINAMFHALNDPTPDTDWIVGETPVSNSMFLTSTVFLSCEDGHAFSPQNTRALLCEAVLNILNRMTDNAKVYEKIAKVLGSHDACIVPVVAEKGAARLIQAMGSNGAAVYCASRPDVDKSVT